MIPLVAPPRRIAAALTLVTVTAFAAVPPQPTLGQENAAPGVAALQRQLAELQKRIEALEERTSAVEAPFTVRDAQGREIFRIDEVNGQPELVFGTEAMRLLSIAVDRETRSPKLVLGKENGARFEVGIAESGNGAFVTLVDQAGVERVSIAADIHATTISLTSAQGFEILNAGVENEEIALVLGTDPGARLEAGLSEGGESSFLKLTDKGNNDRVSLAAGGEEAPLALSDEQADPFFTVKVEQEAPQMVLGKGDAARLQAGVTKGGAGSFISLIDQANSENAFITAEGADTVLALADEQNAEFFSVRFVQQKPRLTVGTPDGARLQAGVTTGGDGSYLSLIDGSDEERASITALTSNTVLSLSDQHMQTDLGSTDESGKRGGLFFGKDELAFVSVRAGATDGGSVTVMNAKGDAVAGILADDEGGEVHVTGPNGGVSQAMIGGTSRGGLFYLYEPSGHPRVSLEGMKAGSVTVQGDAGVIRMTSGETAPRVELGDSAGTPVVQLGVTTDGAGIVRTGPGGNGPAGTLGSGLKPASSIQGK